MDACDPNARDVEDEAGEAVNLGAGDDEDGRRGSGVAKDACDENERNPFVELDACDKNERRAGSGVKNLASGEKQRQVGVASSASSRCILAGVSLHATMI